jgi:hypothetical protein
MSDSPELEAVRTTLARLAGPAAQPSEAAVARTWSRITAPAAAPAPRLAPGRRWLPVAAVAAVVVVIALLANVVLRPAPAPPTSLQVGGSPAPKTTPPKTPPTTAPARTMPTAHVPDHGTVLGPVPLRQAIDAMVAASANAPAWPVAPGQLLYHRTDWYEVDTAPGAPPGGRVDIDWYDPNSMSLRRMIRTAIGMDEAGSVPAGGPSFEKPSVAWLAQVTTDPTALYRIFADLNAGTKLGGDHYVTEEVFTVFERFGPLLSPKLRAALFRVVGMVNGVTANQTTVDGRPYYGILDVASQPNSNAFLLCDPATGQVVGERYAYGSIQLWSYAVVNSTDEMP